MIGATRRRTVDQRDGGSNSTAVVLVNFVEHTFLGIYIKSRVSFVSSVCSKTSKTVGKYVTGLGISG